MGKGIKYFDYLPKYAKRIEFVLGLEPLESKITHWRRFGLGDKDGIAVGCRKITEISLRNMLGLPSSDKTDFVVLIERAHEKNLIPRSIKLKCDSIRHYGNDGAHASIRSLEARLALETLDDFFRWFVGENLAGDGFVRNVPTGGYDDEMFYINSPEEVHSLALRSDIATALSDNDSLRELVSSLQRAEKEHNEKFSEMLSQLDSAYATMEMLSEQCEGDREKIELLTAKTEQLLSLNDQLIAQEEEAREALRNQMEQAKQIVDEVLGEYDFIHSLLRGDNSATQEQMDVLAFPKNADEVKTTVLKLNGSAGTGKTLCLLAKVLRHVEADKSMRNRADEKKALFVCFNKTLAEYIERLLNQCSRDFPYAKQRIAVRSLDAFVNSLVKTRPARDDAFRNNAQDVRYPDLKWSIHYEGATGRGGGFELTRQAMQTVASMNPEKASEYYLDAGTTVNTQWVADEIRYLEAKYGTPATAEGYLNMDSRFGRGGARKPDADVRAVIIEVWRQYYELLERAKKYTIDQAMHRLLRSSDLPGFDAIAIDECQDLSVLAIRLLYAMRKVTPGSFLYVSGDEGQKIFPRDFSWKALDAHAVCHGITLKENKRNAKGIAAFANRLNGGSDEKVDDGSVIVANWSDDEAVSIVADALDNGDIVGIIGGPLSRTKRGLPKSRNLTQVGELSAKGLEFDVVLVDYDKAFADEKEQEKRLRYVHFTRARKKLYVRYSDPAPDLMVEHYSDW